MFRVLIVDDDSQILDAIEEFALETFNCDITRAENGVDALRLALANDYDLVVTDQNMPRMTGLEFIDQIKRTKPDLAIILFSSCTTACSKHSPSITKDFKALQDTVGLFAKLH